MTVFPKRERERPVRESDGNLIRYKGIRPSRSTVRLDQLEMLDPDRDKRAEKGTR